MPQSVGIVSPPYNSGATQIGSIGPGNVALGGWNGAVSSLTMIPNTPAPINPSSTLPTGAAGSSLFNPYNGGLPPATFGNVPHVFFPPASSPNTPPTNINSGWQIQVENAVKSIQNWFASLFASPSQSQGTNPTPPVSGGIQTG